MGAPQFILLALYLMALGFAVAKHGQPRTPYSGPETLVSAVIVFSLLWWGGFFGGQP